MEYLSKVIDRAQLKEWIDKQQDFALIDILPREFYEEIHLPGAANACVYEADFLAQVGKIVPNRTKPIVVYGNNTASKAGAHAMQKLVRASYTRVYLYKGGIIDWRRAGHPIEGTGPSNVPPPQVENRVYAIDPGQSCIEWIGRNLAGSHYGTINILDGKIPIQRGMPVNASFTIDMNSITNLDLVDPTLNSLLVGHLKSDDFFDVEIFSTAQFDAVAFRPINGAQAGEPNFEVTGKLTIKGIAQTITFPAIISLTENRTIAAEAHFDIDRTRWNVIYGSGKIFEKLGRHLVNDHITILLKLVAK